MGWQLWSVCCQVGLNPISCSSSLSSPCVPHFVLLSSVPSPNCVLLDLIVLFAFVLFCFFYHCVLLDWTLTLTVVSALGLKAPVPCVSGRNLISFYRWSFDFLQNIRPVSCWIDYHEICFNLKYVLEDTNNWTWLSIDFSWSSTRRLPFCLGSIHCNICQNIWHELVAHFVKIFIVPTGWGTVTDSLCSPLYHKTLGKICQYLFLLIQI